MATKRKAIIESSDSETDVSTLWYSKPASKKSKPEIPIESTDSSDDSLPKQMHMAKPPIIIESDDNGIAFDEKSSESAKENLVKVKSTKRYNVVTDSSASDDNNDKTLQEKNTKNAINSTESSDDDIKTKILSKPYVYFLRNNYIHP